ncbi:hypothetical protein [Streptomyces sp. TR02-1]|uniref:hypothetical protein n=1 Tax=Streptomyces sp. TR02-1 TaxID=3385977 RepID=UPI0039A2A6A8
MLGCAQNYQVQLHWRRGEQVYASTFDGTRKVEWGRRLCETSESIVTVGKRLAGAECCRLLGRAQPWAHEMSVYRDGDLVWQGPLTNVRERRGDFILQAHDITAWAARRWVNRTVSEETKDIARHVEWLFASVIGDDGENILPYVQVRDAGIREPWAFKKFSRYALDELIRIADLGVDWTTVGRHMLIGPEADKNTPAQGQLSTNDFLSDLEIEVNGMAAATDVAAVGDEGKVGRVGGWTATWDRLQTLISVPGEKSEARLRNIASTHVRQARPPLTVLRIPADAALSPTSQVEMRQLVAGEKFVITAADFCRPVRVGMRLAQLQCTWEAGQGASSGGEKVGVSFTPLRGEEVEDEGEGGV